MAENMAYQCMEDGQWNMPTLRLSRLIVRFSTMLKQSHTSRPVSREHGNHFLSIVRHTNAEKSYHQRGQLTHFHCTIVRSGPPHLAGSHMSFVSLADV